MCIRDSYLYFHYATSEYHPMTAVRIYAGDTPPTGDEEYYTSNIPNEVGELVVVPGEPLDEATLDEPMGNLSILRADVLPLPYELTGLADVSSVDLVFSLPDYGLGAIIYIQADASITNGLGGGYTAGVEDPATPGEDIVEYDLVPFLSLPEGNVNAILGIGYYTDSTYVTTLKNCPLGLDVKPNLPYLGWCVDLGHHISTGYTYSTALYNSYAADLPDRLMDDDWDMVNYVLNHKQGHYNSIQAAIWYFIGGGGYPTGTEAQAMVEDALANGEGFVPTLDDAVAVIVDISPVTQTTIIEVDLTDE